jgi:Ca-activated chloride channel family protein
LAQPVQVRPLPPTPPGRDVMVCLDCSSSMAADDLEAGSTRFAVARRLAAQFVAGRTHDRIGLVTFGRFADLRCPLTADRDALVGILSLATMVEKEGAEDAPAIGAAVGSAAQALLRTSRAGRVVVLVTDGEENVALPGATTEIAPLHVAQWCRQEGIRVHAVVVGAGAAADGRTASIDTTAVQQLASATGGRLHVARDAQALAAVYAAIDVLEQAPAVSPGTVAVEWFQALLGLGLVLLALARGLAATWLLRLP